MLRLLIHDGASILSYLFGILAEHMFVNGWSGALQVRPRFEIHYIFFFGMIYSPINLRKFCRKYSVKNNLFYSDHFSTADTCKNCGKSFKIGTNKLIKIKIRVEGISRIFCFCSYANMAASDKGISLKRKFFNKFLLNFMT